MKTTIRTLLVACALTVPIVASNLAFADDLVLKSAVTVDELQKATQPIPVATLKAASGPATILCRGGVGDIQCQRRDSDGTASAMAAVAEPGANGLKIRIKIKGGTIIIIIGPKK